VQTLKPARKKKLTKGGIMEGKSIRKSMRESISHIDVVDHCARKIAFIREFFCHSIPDDELFSKDARAGLQFILDDLEDDLEFVVDQFYHGPNRFNCQKKRGEETANRGETV
jgi:hypothetical protein